MEQPQIIVTGAAGFIGSCMVQLLNDRGYTNLIVVDDFGVEEKRINWESKQFTAAVERHALLEWLEEKKPTIAAVIHLGARTDTTEFDYAIHETLNVQYSQALWKYCTAHAIPFIYASSAATYGDGAGGYNDDHASIPTLKPLNPYGVSKQAFDVWALEQTATPPVWTGLKFFNVYGPNEYHKGRMASVIWHSFNQIQATGKVKLFKSHREGYQDGEQLRDFVYVKDVIEVIFWMTTSMLSSRWSEERNGIYNLGTGEARSFIDLVIATFNGLDKYAQIDFIEMPEDIRDKYQYFTEATMDKLRTAGYTEPFYSLEDGVDDYVRNYLAAGKKIY